MNPSEPNPERRLRRRVPGAFGVFAFFTVFGVLFSVVFPIGKRSTGPQASRFVVFGTCAAAASVSFSIVSARHVGIVARRHWFRENRPGNLR